MLPTRKILFVFGTRPEAIKLAPVINGIKKHFPKHKALVCTTGQHRQMLDQVLTLFKIKPDVDLNLMKPNQTLSSLTAKVIESLDKVMKMISPDLVVVQGDTTSTFGATLSAFYSKIPVAHIEAGLRTGNIYSPWPEEINRKITTSIAALHFAPTKESEQNLIRENIPRSKIYVTGNTVIDCLFTIQRDILSKPQIGRTLERKFSFLDKNKKVLLITGHRRENFGGGFRNICLAIKKISETHPDVQCVYPVHLNPNVRQPVMEILGTVSNRSQSKISLIEPLDYLPFVYLMTRSHIILTDSGGVQEEAPSLGKPVLVMRDTTERPEAVRAGTVQLIGADYKTIVSQTNKLLNNSKLYNKMKKTHNPYGDGKAFQRIAMALKKNGFL